RVLWSAPGILRTWARQASAELWGRTGVARKSPPGMGAYLQSGWSPCAAELPQTRVQNLPGGRTTDAGTLCLRGRIRFEREHGVGNGGQILYMNRFDFVVRLVIPESADAFGQHHIIDRQLFGRSSQGERLYLAAVRVKASGLNLVKGVVIAQD